MPRSTTDYMVTDFCCDPDAPPDDWKVDEPLYEPLDEWDEGDEWDADADLIDDEDTNDESENY